VAEIRLFDSHLHLTAPAFDEDREAVIGRARAAGVTELVSVASDPEDAREAIALATAHDRIWATAGLHPHEAKSFGPDLMADLEVLAQRREVVAIGETGLDYHYENAPRDQQRRCFRAQLELAERCSLPVVVHSRDADADTAALLSEFAGRVIGVLHCFTGGEALLGTGLDAGWYVSFGGIVTFKSFEGRAAVRRVPDDRLLIETDSPYLSPVPLRGRRNEPSHLVHTCRRVADMRDAFTEKIGEITRHNALALFGLS